MLKTVNTQVGLNQQNGSFGYQIKSKYFLFHYIQYVTYITENKSDQIFPQDYTHHPELRTLLMGCT